MKKTYSIGFPLGGIGVLLIALKAAGVLPWSWMGTILFVVFLPVISFLALLSGVFGVAFAAGVIILVGAFFSAVANSWNK